MMPHPGYSAWRVAIDALRGGATRGPAWTPCLAPRAHYDAIIVGAGGHGLATAHALARHHGITDVAVIEKGALGLGNQFPVFSKPITNLRGMGIGSRVFDTLEAYEQHHTPGHFWLPLLNGRHVSSDVALHDGSPVWWRHATGTPARDGMFTHWVIEAAADRSIEQHAERWLRQHLAGYTGLVNLETIGGTIIEVHLRFADQWPDLYGAGWVEAAIGLYAGNGWHFDDGDRHDGYSLALFGPHGRRYRHPPSRIVEKLTSEDGVSSVQITFHEKRAPEHHAMPPGGFRLAIVNGSDFEACAAARECLREHLLGSTPAVNLGDGQRS